MHLEGGEDERRPTARARKLRRRLTVNTYPLPLDLAGLRKIAALGYDDLIA